MQPLSLSSSGYVSMVYFASWAAYTRHFAPRNLPIESLSHVSYSFADVNHVTGEVFMPDKWAAYDKHFPGDSWMDNTDKVYGDINQFFQLKNENRHLKVLLSIGGWGNSPHMKEALVKEDAQKNFIRTALYFLKNYGFDGLELDWEYPEGPVETKAFLSICRTLRAELDKYSEELYKRSDNPEKRKPRFYLSFAAPAGAHVYNQLPIEELSDVLDYFNVMLYDYAGSWSKKAQALNSLRLTKDNSTLIGTENVIKDYLAKGARKEKLIFGLPLYGRTFEKTDGPGKEFNGAGFSLITEGVFGVNQLPLQGMTVTDDYEAGASWGYDSEKRLLVSYDPLNMSQYKANWATSESHLGGLMWWEASFDYDTPDKSYIKRTVKDVLKDNIDRTPNWLWYPDSKFVNIRESGGGEPLPKDYDNDNPSTSQPDQYPSSSSNTTQAKSHDKELPAELQSPTSTLSFLTALSTSTVRGTSTSASASGANASASAGATASAIALDSDHPLDILSRSARSTAPQPSPTSSPSSKVTVHANANASSDPDTNAAPSTSAKSPSRIAHSTPRFRADHTAQPPHISFT